MGRVTEPADIENEALRDLAVRVAYDAKLGEAMADLEMLCDDLPPAERFSPDGDDLTITEETDALDVVRHLLLTSLPQMSAFLEEAIAMWLEEDPEHWAIMRLTVILPWQDSAGQWQADVPDWILFFGAFAAGAEEKFGPFGRQPQS